MGAKVKFVIKKKPFKSTSKINVVINVFLIVLVTTRPKNEHIGVIATKFHLFPYNETTIKFVGGE